jgi:hypothetical protein
MRKLIAIFATFAALPIGIGCHAQVPPATAGYQVNLTATLPAPSGNWLGCVSGQPQCTFAVYAETIAGSTCDPTTSTNYKEITNPASRPTTPNFTDPNTTGLTKCYDMETVQSGENSGPSNVAGPVVSPGVPLAPTLATPSPQQAQLNSLPGGVPAPQLAKKLSAPTGLKAMAAR